MSAEEILKLKKELVWYKEQALQAHEALYPYKKEIDRLTVLVTELNKSIDHNSIYRLKQLETELEDANKLIRHYRERIKTTEVKTQSLELKTNKLKDKMYEVLKKKEPSTKSKATGLLLKICKEFIKINAFFRTNYSTYINLDVFRQNKIIPIYILIEKLMYNDRFKEMFNEEDIPSILTFNSKILKMLTKEECTAIGLIDNNPANKYYRILI